MKTLKFKTNINCGGCVAKVTPVLNEMEGITKWEVDTANPQKTLTIETDSLKEDDLIAKLSTVGFKAESVG